MKKLLIAAVSLLIFSCTEKPKDDGKNFHIDGTVEGLPDGEKLLLTDIDGQVIDTMTVAQGKFAYSAKTDTVSFFTIFVMNNPSNNVNIFTEPGTVQVRITAKTGEASVGGTTANDALNVLMQETNPYYEKINELEDIVANDTTLSPESDWAIGERYMQFYGEIERKMKEAAAQNIDNELGYMLVVRFIDEEQNIQLLRELIAKMPEKFRQRKPVINLLTQLNSYETTVEGRTMPDFKLNTPDGVPTSVIGVVKQHKFTIIDFWASWCNPCHTEMSFMRQLYADFSAKGLGIIGISLDDHAEDWQKAITDLKMEWTQLSDLKGRDADVARAFRIHAIPYMVVVDSVGTILKKGLRGDDLREYIDGLLSAR